MSEPQAKPNRILAAFVGLLFLVACVCGFELAVGTGIRPASGYSYSLADSMTARATAFPTYQTPPPRPPAATPTLPSTPTITATVAPSATMTAAALPTDGVSPAATATSVANEVATEKGFFSIPGSGYIDGRDLWAESPLTVMTINLQPFPGATALDPPQCQLAHGTEVELLELQQDPGSDELFYTFRVRHEACEGWVSWLFIGDAYHEPIGEITGATSSG